MKAFRVTGSYRAGKRDQPYSVDLVASDKDEAMERVLSNFGSRHRVTRRFVLVDDISEIDPSDSKSPVVVAHFGTSPTIGGPKTEEE
ncbi:MAG: 50S ribosomal protein L18Ae [Candidatus Thermoplasmatota archaeon]|nr:50S ribosomal protein L18Ae [Candidatus Thermoplasmatota archaeon]